MNNFINTIPQSFGAIAVSAFVLLLCWKVKKICHEMIERGRSYDDK